MNALRFRALRAWCGLLLAVLVTQALSAGESAGPPKAKLPAEKKDKAEQMIFRLKYIPAKEASRILRELYGPKGSVSIGVDDRTNALILSGTKAYLTQAEAILNKLDVEGSARVGDLPQLKVFSLAQYRVEPDDGLESMLRMLVPSGRSGKFTIDHRRKVVAVFADEATLAQVQMLLITLGGQREANPAAKPASSTTDLQVRLFWLVSGRGRRAGDDLPDNFKEIAGELARLGMAQPHLATQLAVSSETGARFETAASVALPGAHDLTVSGFSISRDDRLGLSLTIRVSQAAPRRTSRRAVSLRTVVSVPLDRPVLLGVTPGETLTSAFVVQVSRVQASPKKAAKLIRFDFDKSPWKTVFAWLGEQTGKEVIRTSEPRGTFTFRGDKKKMYTIGEVVDLLNEAMLAGTQKYLLIQRERNFIIVPADERHESLLPRVSIEELAHRGKTELVSVTLRLKNAKVGDVGPEIKKLLGPFGEVVIMDSVNRLVVQDCAGNLRRVCELLKEIDQPKKK
jgi:type II secretory pathway component GspD/PulD (secretin)